MLRRTRRPSASLAVALLLTAKACAPPQSPVPATGTVIQQSVHFPSLEGAPASGGATRTVRVYLPPGYERGRAAHPVVYLLHGGGESGARWIGGATDVPRMMDRLIGARVVPPTIVVMPDARDGIGGGFFTDSPLLGRWESFLARDLVAHVDSAFRTVRAPEGRALAGYSMGGFGALRVAFEHPSTFGSVYALSPCCMGMEADLGPANPAWRMLLDAGSPRDVGAEAGIFYAAAAAFSPDASAPLGVRLPVRLDGDAVVVEEGVRDRWLALSPLGIARDRAAAPRSLRAIGFDAGEQDPLTHIPVSARMLSDALAAAGIAHRFETYPGDHGSGVARRMEEVMFPFLAAQLATPR